MLLPSKRHRPSDLEAWAAAERADAVRAQSPRLVHAAERAMAAASAFVEAGPCYAGVSWGKDSVVLVDLLARAGIRVPVVWVRVDQRENPDCPAVRDAFLATHPGVDYHEILVEAADGAAGHLTSAAGFVEAARRFGDRHLSGVRGAESSGRQRRMQTFGTTTDRTCAPIGWWSTDDVFAYLHARNLPVHPVYAMSLGGRLDRNQLRVASLGGERGTGNGRREWERAYYPHELAMAERARGASR